METKKPVALWKGIVGIAVSGFVLLIVASVFVPLCFVLDGIPMWLIVWAIIAAVICSVTLIISIFNIRDALIYRRQNRTIKTSSNEADKKHDVDYIEEIKMLKELLDSGAITQEEFDAKKKQLLK